MSVFATGTGLFLMAFVAHVLWWRRRRPRQSAQTLIYLLTAVVLLGWIIAIIAASTLHAASDVFPADPFAWLQALTLALALAAAYVLTYPALEVDSPTLVIIEAIAERGPAGIAAEEFHRRLNDSVLVMPRLQDLLDEGLVVLKNDHYAPTRKGVMLARIFIAWRKLLRAGVGG
jgi:hypothetical protein